jgi:DNA-directed RNA polymerase beta' subunit
LGPSGDEMNLHMPQDLESEAELRNLAAIPYQIISPANNSSIIGIFQDSMLGSYQFSRSGIKFTPRDAMNLLMMFDGINENKLLESIERNNGRITNFEILSQIMPPLSMKYKTKAFKDTDDAQTSNAVLEIKNGDYIRGQMDKSVLGAGTKGLLQRVCNDFGNMASAKFIDDLQNVVTEYMKSSAFSVGISDLISDKKTNDNIVQVITKKKTDVKNLIDQVQIGLFENNTGKTNEQEFETQVNSILNQATSESGKIGLKNLDKNNRFVIMVNAGSKGSDLNISQMISCLGQQNVDGKRIPYGFENRTLPHFTKYDDSPGARGFVESSYINGLSPQELFFHAMGGRVGLIDTAVKTSTTGYIQRRLIKGLEDLMVSYDMTVRTNKNKIIQFKYGDDNIDTTKVENQVIPIVSMSQQDIYAHYLVPEESSKVKTLSNIFLKNTFARHKKQNADFMKKTQDYIDMMISRRDSIIKKVFKNKGDSVVNCPVAFAYIISNIQGQCNISISSLVDITLLEALEMIEHYYENLEKNYYAPPTELFKILYYYYLSPKDLLIIKHFNKAALTLLLETITISYKRAIVAPGEMVGMIAGQSIGEISTQMSASSSEKFKIIQKNKKDGNIQLISVEIGQFCDNLISQLPDMTFNTGHVNSVETLLETLDEEYYIIGVSEDERTHWNKISHISRHPVNGQMMKVTTRSGRVVETTTSHSHLIRDGETQKVVPIVGANMKEGMRIPVAKYIENSFIENSISIGNKEFQLDYLFGWFIGAYLAEGNISNTSICITNISSYFIENTKKIAKMFDKECRINDRQGEYGPSIQTSFSDKKLATFLLDTCNTGSFVKRVPDFAFTAPNEFKAGLIQAYMDGDGNFHNDKDHHQMRVCSRSKQLIKDIALLLNYFDISASIKETFTKGSPLFDLNISCKYSVSYKEQIGSVLHSDKLDELVNYVERFGASTREYIDKINGLGDIIAKCAKDLVLPGQSRSYGCYKKKESIGRATLEKYISIFETHQDSYKIQDEIKILKQAVSSNVIWDEVLKIEYYTPDQTDYVYDFTVPGNQTFMTDYGVIVHNTLNSVTFETEINVRNARGKIETVQIGDFIEKKIKIATKTQYMKEKDTTYAELDDFYDIQSPDQDGNILWKRIEAVTRHPVINEDGTNTMLKITTKQQREVIVTKAKSLLKLINGKIIPINGDKIKVGDYLPVSNKRVDFTETFELDLKTILIPTEYIYASEVEKAKSVMCEHCWWSKHNGKTFQLPYKRSDSFVVKVSDKLRNGCKTKTTFQSNCIYTLQTNMNNYTIPEVIPLDYNFGYLLGAYAAEGCMTKTQISIANNDAEYFAPILELCQKWNITTKMYRHEDKNNVGWLSQDMRIYNTVLCRLLEKICGKLSHNKFVLDQIVYSNKDCILGFMDAYIGGDGTINKKSKIISMSSVSKNLLIDVQQMLNILDIYSYIKKYKKPDHNNRGTLPENIHQLYYLNITGSQLHNFASMLNIKLKYKQELLGEILKHKYDFKINKMDTIIPNEIDGEIVFEKRHDNYADVLFDVVQEIEEVPNTTDYAYDLTVADTRTFLLRNGMLGDDTFHFAGVASKSNVTRGVPRIEEILSLSSNIKNPSLSIALKPKDERQKEKAQSIMYMLEHTKLEEIVKSVEVCFDPDDLNTLIEEDKDTIAQYKAFEQMVAECSEQAVQNDENEKSKWIIRMEMDPEVMLEKNITMDDVNFTLNNCYEKQISCVYSDLNADKLVFRIRMAEVLKSGSGKGGPQNKIKVNPLDQSDHIYLLKNFQDQLLQNVVLRGIKGINKVILRKVIDNMVENNGIYKKEEIWVLDTIGTNLLDVLGLNFIDSTRTMSNDIVEIYNILGIEAARQAIYNELVDVVEFDGTYVNYHNYSVLVDRMTFTHKLISIFRHGINNDNIGAIAKASFEETPEMFLKAARHAELDTLRGVSANVMCGQEGFFGTAAFQVVLNIEEMQKMEEASPYKSVNVEEEIEKFFGGVETETDPCSIHKIAVQNNVDTIHSVDMGKDNTYNPGF